MEKNSKRLEQDTSSVSFYDEIADHVVQLGQQLDLDIDSSDINQIIQIQSNELENGDLLNIEVENVAKDSDKNKSIRNDDI